MKKNILVCNDDGINAEGLRAIVKTLGNLANVYVVAPVSQASAKSHAVTFLSKLTVTECDLKGAEEAWSLDGTPTDCVMWGLQFYRNKGINMDYVIGGINHGPNVGHAVHYSGTVAIAQEAAMQGIRGIALSVNSHKATQFDYICNIIDDVLKLSDEFDPSIYLSVNAPDMPVWKIKGVKIQPLAECGYGETYEYFRDEDSKFQLSIKELPVEKAQDNDYEALEAGYATITALSYVGNNGRAMKQLQRLASNKALCLFVDFQEKLVPAMRKSEELMSNVTKFARCMYKLDAAMMTTTQYSKGLGDTCSELADAIGKHENIEKLSFSCWDNAEFREKMDSLAIKVVIIAGIESHICVQQTAMDFLAEGFVVYVLDDCCASRKKNNHEIAMRQLADAGCIVTSWEALVYELLGDATHTAFRSISQIVKED